MSESIEGLIWKSVSYLRFVFPDPPDSLTRKIQEGENMQKKERYKTVFNSILKTYLKNAAVGWRESRIYRCQ